MALSWSVLAAVGWLLAGLAALVAGAELVVRSGARSAALLGVSPIVIGLTIVAVGTSAPELGVGIQAVLAGSGSLAVGNIAGTNTVNILLILGLSALLHPLKLSVQTVRFGLPVMIVAAIALTQMAWDGLLTRTEGALLVTAALLYTLVIVGVAAGRESRAVRAEYAKEYRTRGGRGSRAVLWALTVLLVGIAIIVVGADWLVDGAVELAQTLGVSDAFIGLTIVAIGTSAPELVTTVVSTLRQERDIAVGNLLGSSVYNIAFILGVACLVAPSGIPVATELVRVDIPVMTLVTLVCVPVFISGHRVNRLEGGLFVAAYFAYLSYLVLTRT